MVYVYTQMPIPQGIYESWGADWNFVQCSLYKNRLSTILEDFSLLSSAPRAFSPEFKISELGLGVNAAYDESLIYMYAIFNPI